MKNKLTGCFTAAIFVLLVTSCSRPSYEGKYLTNEACHLLEYIEIFPDKTADVKFRSIKEAVNWPVKVKPQTSDTLVSIKDYEFIYRNDSLVGTSANTYNCICIKKALYDSLQQNPPEKPVEIEVEY